MTGKISVSHLALVNSVLYDSWPVPSVARFRDLAIAEATSTAEVLTARMESLITALARPTSQQEIEDHLDPWNDPRVARSWLALAGAADNRYTLELLTGLRLSDAPKLIVWGPSRRPRPSSTVGTLPASPPIPIRAPHQALMLRFVILRIRRASFRLL
jgi:hypothetical protein